MMITMFPPLKDKRYVQIKNKVSKSLVAPSFICHSHGTTFFVYRQKFLFGIHNTHLSYWFLSIILLFYFKKWLPTTFLTSTTPLPSSTNDDSFDNLFIYCIQCSMFIYIPNWNHDRCSCQVIGQNSVESSLALLYPITSRNHPFLDLVTFDFHKLYFNKDMMKGVYIRLLCLHFPLSLTLWKYLLAS